MEWAPNWAELVSADYGGDPAVPGGFALTPIAMPCCGMTSTLNDLIYDWPQAFGRFALCAEDPNVGTLSASEEQELYALLGTGLRTIYQHL